MGNCHRTGGSQPRTYLSGIHAAGVCRGQQLRRAGPEPVPAHLPDVRQISGGRCRQAVRPCLEERTGKEFPGHRLPPGRTGRGAPRQETCKLAKLAAPLTHTHAREHRSRYRKRQRRKTSVRPPAPALLPGLPVAGLPAASDRLRRHARTAGLTAAGSGNRIRPPSTG